MMKAIGTHIYGWWICLKGGTCRPLLLLKRPSFNFLDVYLLESGLPDGLGGFITALTSTYAMFDRCVKPREIDYPHAH